MSKHRVKYTDGWKIISALRECRVGIQIGGGLDCTGGSGTREVECIRAILGWTGRFHRTVRMKEGESRMLPRVLAWASWLNGGATHWDRNRSRSRDYHGLSLTGHIWGHPSDWNLRKEAWVGKVDGKWEDMRSQKQSRKEWTYAWTPWANSAYLIEEEILSF